jgi:hypothetical protein
MDVGDQKSDISRGPGIAKMDALNVHLKSRQIHAYINAQLQSPKPSWWVFNTQKKNPATYATSSDYTHVVPYTQQETNSHQRFYSYFAFLAP